MPNATFQLKTYIRSCRSQFEEMLGEMVEIPSVSSDPHCRKDIQAMARLAVQYLKGFGAEARMVKTGGLPVVTGGWHVGKQFPILTIYNHLDVQPAQEPEWRHEPFRFHKEGKRYHGRGATDDKGPALTALFAARYAIDHDMPLNIRFVWELEEEIGSPNFQRALDQTRLIPKPDSVLVSDTIWVSRQKPAIPAGLRGLLPVQLTLRTGTTEVHSGLTGGGARNPLAELCEIVHACVDARTGRVKIPGFYDDVIPPSRREMKEFVSSGFDVRRFKRAFGLRSLRTEDPARLLKGIWGMPTFEVHGVVGGYQGKGVKTVVPPAGQLKVSMRLVPHQNPQKILSRFKAFVKKLNPDIRVECDGQLEPFRGVTSGPYAEALRKAVQVGFGKVPSLVREGGSIGAVKLMERSWRVPILFMGLSLPEHGYHAPNEYFDWGQASGGMQAFVEYFSRVAKIR